MAFGDVIQSIGNDTAGVVLTATTSSVTLASTPTSGNLLIYILTPDKNSGTITMPTGFSKDVESLDSGVSGAIGAKISDGTESGAITASWANSVNGSVAVVEIEGPFASPLTVSGSSIANTGASSSTSLSTGSTGVLSAADGYAIVGAGIDTSTGSDSWSFSSPATLIIDTVPVSGGGATGAGGFVVSATTAVDNTATMTRSDNLVAGIVVYEKDTGGGTSITPTDTTPDDASLQTITASGMTGPVTAASIGGLDILSDLSGTDPTVAITFTTDVSATETSTGMPRIGETSTISFTTATDGAVTTDVTMQPKANWTTVTLAGTLDKTANGFLDTLDTDLGVTSAVGDIIYYSNARGEAITATGVYTGGTTVAYQSTEFVFQDVTGASATVTATSEGGQFYPFGEGASGIPVASRQTWGDLVAYLYDQGYRGTSDDIVSNWLYAEGQRGTQMDKFNKYLKDLGYTGTFSDKMNQWRDDA